MKICILLDFDTEADTKTKTTYLNSIIAFTNAFLLLNNQSQFVVINNRTIIFDSIENRPISDIFSTDVVLIAIGDINYAMLLSPDFIVVCTMFKNSLVYENVLKCIGAAIQLNIKIHVFCTDKSNMLKLLAVGSKGFCIENNFLEFIKLLGTDNREPTYDLQVKCYCCSKDTQIGFCCPICLTVYCKFTPICKRCKTKFNFPKRTK